MGKAKDWELVVLLFDRRDMLPQLGIPPESAERPEQGSDADIPSSDESGLNMFPMSGGWHSALCVTSSLPSSMVIIPLSLPRLLASSRSLRTEALLVRLLSSIA